MDIKVREAYLKKAMELHATYPVVDAHLDLAGEILLRRQAGEKDIIRRYYLENWKRAGIKLIVSSVYVPTKILNERGIKGAWEDTLMQIDALKEDCDSMKEIFLVTCKNDLEHIPEENRIGILLYMEGLDCIGREEKRLDELHSMGVRGASLTWSRENALATGCCKAGEYRQISGGLTEFGKQIVRKMEEMHWFLDISHLNDDGFEDIAVLTKKPFLATHSCARAVYDNYRNLTDSQMKRLSGKGGIIGLNGCRFIAGSKGGNHLEMLCRHAEYEVEKVGAEHVGFGFDLCDSYDRAFYVLQKEKDANLPPPKEADCLLNHGQIPLLTAALLQRGMKEKDVIAIMGGSFLACFKEILPEEQFEGEGD